MRLLSRVPIARSIYSGVKQLFEAIFSGGPRVQFNRVILIEYPRRGVYALAFTTGTASGVVQEITEQQMINCFLPTTPNPTSGIFLLVPREEVNFLKMSVEEGLKIVVSSGTLMPPFEASKR